ncbi:unnamed protein product [Rhizophagus irregularis]|nr:unnamed protein product [Rhizophagus irregularis]
MKGENERGKRKGKGKTKGDGFPKEYFKIHSGGLLKNGKPKDSIGWASDLWEKRNQDSIGWSGLLTFGKRRTKIRKSRVSQVSSEERKKPKIRKFRWIAKEQSKIRIYEYMNHVIVELYLN